VTVRRQAAHPSALGGATRPGAVPVKGSRVAGPERAAATAGQEVTA
jgi:hypothetical protein